MLWKGRRMNKMSLKRIISCSLLFAIIFLLSSCGGTEAKGENVINTDQREEILFNDIPWGTSYLETIHILKEKYQIDFTEPLTELKVNKQLSDVRIANSTQHTRELPFSIITAFEVVSTSTVTIAGHDAYIDLIFGFNNDGRNVINSSFDDGVLMKASYCFYEQYWPYEVSWSVSDRHYLIKDICLNYNQYQSIKEELAVSLKSVYGIDFLEELDHYPYRQVFVYGNNNSILCFDTNDAEIFRWYLDDLHPKSIRIVYTGGNYDFSRNYDILSNKIKLEYEKQQKEYIESIPVGDTNGL